MWNYILADYRRILTRLPRLIFLAVYEIIIIAAVLISMKKGGDSYSSVNFTDSLNLWVFTFGSLFLGASTLVNVFTDDFKAKTMQAAIGAGVTRMQVVISKLVQVSLILLSDILVTGIVIAVMSIVAGVTLVWQQVSYILVEALSILLHGTCWISIVSILVFKLQSLLLPMVVYFGLEGGLLGFILSMLTRSGPEFLQNLHLDNLVPDHLLDIFRSNLLVGNLHPGAAIGIVLYTALGVYLTYLVFRRQELEF